MQMHGTRLRIFHADAPGLVNLFTLPADGLFMIVRCSGMGKSPPSDSFYGS